MAFPDGVRYVVTDGYPWLEFFDDEHPNDGGAPFMRQDVRPDGSDWENTVEVQEFAEACLQEWRNPPETEPLPEEGGDSAVTE